MSGRFGAEYAADDGLNDLSKITIECWIYIRSFRNSIGYIISRVDSGAIIDHMGEYGDHFMARTRRSDNALVWIVNNNLTTYRNQLNAKEWYHIAFTWDGVVLQILVNGELKSTVYTSTNLNVTNGIIQIGSYNDEFGLDGLIDEIRIWNYERSHDEIINNMNTKLTGNESGLVAYWQLDEGQGQNVSDSAGENLGVLGSSSNEEENDPDWVECEISTVNVERKRSVVNDNFLSHNYPNPFNSYTKIIYKLLKPSNVNLSVYNHNGQKIETLLNCFQTIGEHEIIWQPKGLPSGLYFYRLHSGEFLETKKLILQK